VIENNPSQSLDVQNPKARPPSIPKRDRPLTSELAEAVSEVGAATRIATDEIAGNGREDCAP